MSRFVSKLSVSVIFSVSLVWLSDSFSFVCLSVAVLFSVGYSFVSRGYSLLMARFKTVFSVLTSAVRIRPSNELLDAS